jgi:hypothetical protein
MALALDVFRAEVWCSTVHREGVPIMAESRPQKPQDGSRESTRIRPEDLPGYTPQGRSEPSDEDFAANLPGYTPQGQIDSEEDESETDDEKRDDQGRPEKPGAAN